MHASIPATVTACLAVLLGSGTALANSDPVVIELGDISVTRNELNDRFQVAVRILASQQGISLAEQSPSVIERLRVQYLDKRATELILLQEAARRDVTVLPEAVEEAVGEALAIPGARQQIVDEPGASGIDGEKILREIVRDEKTVQGLTELMLREISIPPGDVVTLHHDIKHTLITPEQVCLRHVQTDDIESAQQILAALENDADFSELASRHSTDQASAGNGGDVGCFQKGHGAAKSKFEEAAFAAKKGIVGPVESEFGYHVIEIYDYKPPHEMTLNEAFNDIERELKREKLPTRVNALISESGIRTYPKNFTVSDIGG
jgi:parvulin-like peptidyl-prolyl isomerase